MSGFLVGRQALIDLTLLNVLFALSQYVVLRAGVFSVGAAGLGAIGAYTAGNLILNLDVHPVLAIAGGMVAGLVVGAVLSIPLARLRGVFQAIATLAFVQIILSVALYAEPLTGGATGLNGIPKSVGTYQLVAVVAVVLWLLANLNRSSTGRAFDITSQNENVAVAFGVDVLRLHALAFALSGAIAGLAGALSAAHNYSVVPEEFGFNLVVALLSFVVFGGRRSLAGPVLGAVFLTWLPEIARPLAENRMIIYGALLIGVIIYLPHGLIDTLLINLRRRRRAAAKNLTRALPEGSTP
jgi:branched-chain amino acid transport system permease protein